MQERRTDGGCENPNDENQFLHLILREFERQREGGQVEPIKRHAADDSHGNKDVEMPEESAQLTAYASEKPIVTVDSVEGQREVNAGR